LNMAADMSRNNQEARMPAMRAPQQARQVILFRSPRGINPIT
jgi:hypothetical protein